MTCVDVSNFAYIKEQKPPYVNCRGGFKLF